MLLNSQECSLSPLPAGRGTGTCSPGGGTRVSDRHLLYVKPLTTSPPANHQLTYRFSRSPAKVRNVGERGVMGATGTRATFLNQVFNKEINVIKIQNNV